MILFMSERSYYRQTKVSLIKLSLSRAKGGDMAGSSVHLPRTLHGIFVPEWFRRTVVTIKSIAYQRD